jgi:hypothetical protein
VGEETNNGREDRHCEGEGGQEVVGRGRDELVACRGHDLILIPS